MRTTSFTKLKKPLAEHVSSQAQLSSDPELILLPTIYPQVTTSGTERFVPVQASRGIDECKSLFGSVISCHKRVLGRRLLWRLCARAEDVRIGRGRALRIAKPTKGVCGSLDCEGSPSPSLSGTNTPSGILLIHRRDARQRRKQLKR